MDSDNYFELRRISASDYDRYELPRYLARALGEDRKARILDFGCGFGQLMRALAAEGYVGVEGVEIVPEAIAHCRETGLVCIDGTNEDELYGSRGGRYQFVIMSHVLEHFPKHEIVPILRRIRTLLSTDGALLVMVPNAQSHTGCYWAYEDFTHEVLFTSGSLYFVLRAAGFSQIELLDVDCTAGSGPIRKMSKQLLLGLYRWNYLFWNRVTSSAVHRPSPLIFSYEIKALARA